MKVGAGVALVVFLLNAVDGMLNGLNAWVELGLKFAALATFAGASWRWLVGPGWRRLCASVGWCVEQLRLIGQLDDRLDKIDKELTRGHEHFARIDSSIEALASEEARAIRRAIQTGEPVQFTEAGGVERRDPE